MKKTSGFKKLLKVTVVVSILVFSFNYHLRNIHATRPPSISCAFKAVVKDYKKVDTGNDNYYQIELDLIMLEYKPLNYDNRLIDEVETANRRCSLSQASIKGGWLPPGYQSYQGKNAPYIEPYKDLDKVLTIGSEIKGNMDSLDYEISSVVLLKEGEGSVSEGYLIYETINNNSEQPKLKEKTNYTALEILDLVTNGILTGLHVAFFISLPIYLILVIYIIKPKNKKPKLIKFLKIYLFIGILLFLLCQIHGFFFSITAF